MGQGSHDGATSEIEFVGGPMDGERQAFSSKLAWEFHIPRYVLPDIGQKPSIFSSQPRYSIGVYKLGKWYQLGCPTVEVYYYAGEQLET